MSPILRRTALRRFSRTLDRGLHCVFLSILAPATSMYFFYYHFRTVYTTNVFSADGFQQQYTSGVYRYRILGRVGLESVHALIEHLYQHKYLHRAITRSPLAQHLGAPDLSWYHAYFVFNTFWLCVTTALLYGLFSARSDEGRLGIAPTLGLLVLQALVEVSQFVIVPYDTLSYAWLAASVVLIVAADENAGRITALVGLVVAATLTRETAALILAMYAALVVAGPEEWGRKRWSTLGILTLSFLATYVVLRILLGWEHAIGNGWTASLDGRDSYASLTWAGVFIGSFCLAAPVGRRRLGLWFLLFSIPYVLAVFGTGLLVEIRLWVPVLLILLILTAIPENPGRGSEVKDNR